MTPDAPDGEPDPARPWEIELPPWLYNAILRRKDILAVHPDYFRLTGGLERWLYRLARKAVPDKAEVPAIHFRMDTLHERSGSTRPLRNFARRYSQDGRNANPCLNTGCGSTATASTSSSRCTGIRASRPAFLAA